MSEITVRHEVEALLKVTRQRAEQASDGLLDAVSQGAQSGATLAIAEFHGEVLAELDKIIQRYIEGNEPAEAEVVTPARRLEVQVGDKLRLTGDQWDRDVHGYGAGDIITIDRLTSGNNPYEGRFTYQEPSGFPASWYVWTADAEGNEGAYEEWGGDILTDLELEIHVGDTVRINEKYAETAGGESEVGQEFEVTEVVRDAFGDSRFFVRGDRRGFGIWETYIEKVFK